MYGGSPSSADRNAGRRLTETSPDPKSLGLRRDFSPAMDKQSAAARRSELLYPSRVASLEKDNLRLIRELDESVSDTGSDPYAKNED